MNWLERVRAKNLIPTLQPLTELTKGPSVSSEGTFVSSVSPLSGGAEVFWPERGPSGVASPPPPDLIGEPCPLCGSVEKWRWLEGWLLCRACLIHGEARIVAVKVFSSILEPKVWVAADDLPHEQRPTDAPVYTCREVRLLTSMGRDVLTQVHVVKGLFGGHVIQGSRHGSK